MLNHCCALSCTYLTDIDGVVLSLADSDGAMLTDGDEEDEAAAVIVLDGDGDLESEGAAVTDGDNDTDGAAVTDEDDDVEGAAVLDVDDDSEGATVGDTLRCSQHRASNTTPGVSETKQGRESDAAQSKLLPRRS